MQNVGMNPVFKWLLGTSLVFLLLMAALAWFLQRWIGTDDVKARVEAEASSALGVAVKLARIEVAVWPLPAVALQGVEVQTRPPLSAERLEVRPAWRALLAGRLELATLLVRRAMLPQAGIDNLLAALQKKKRSAHAPSAQEPEKASNSQYIPARTVLDHVTWVSAKGASTTLDADVRLDGTGLPDGADLHILQGQFQGAKARLSRQGNEWTLALDVAGGTVKGALQLQPASQTGGEFSIKGQLQTRSLQVAALGGPHPILSGQLQADTTLSARTAHVGSISEVLQTQSHFTVRHAMLHGLDLAKAIKTVGLSRGGETELDVLSGQVTTQGRAAQLTNLVASSGVLRASGNVAISSKQALSGRVSVELASAMLGGAVGVPLVVSGTLDAPEVMLTRSALVGAAIGTALMPGVGTGAGASLGDKVGTGFKKLFGQ
jgi:hypothetical protein